MTFRVELTDNATEEPRGFLGREDDDNPNNNVKVAEYDSVPQAQAAIQAEIDSNKVEARKIAFDILDDEGERHETTYYDEVYGRWETFS